MKRGVAIKALLRRCSEDAAELDGIYAVARSEATLGDSAKVLIKNTFENLRSCLDYFAHEIFESCCIGHKKPDRLYFPIRDSQTQFQSAVQKGFPGLKVGAPKVYQLIESVQPYNTQDAWLDHLNKLNNQNKHEDLADHIRVAGRRITIERDGAIVGIGPNVGIALGATFLDVSIDPISRLPSPSGSAKVTVEPWANFYFEGVECPVNVFLADCIRKVEQLFLAIEGVV